MEWPTQGHAALLVALTSVIITLCLLYFGLKAERGRRADDADDH